MSQFPGRLIRSLGSLRRKGSGVLKEEISSVHSLSCVQVFVTPWTSARQASLSITNSQSLLKLMCIELVMPSNHLILCYPLLLPPSVFPSIRLFSSESTLCMRWPKYWSFSFSISPSNEHSGLISFKEEMGVWNSQWGGKDKCFFYFPSTFFCLSRIKLFFL